MTRTVLSGRGDGGKHLYFGVPRHGKVRSSSRLFGEGIDVLSDGKFVVAPPSRHAAGGRYLFEPVPPADIAPLPLDLLELLVDREMPGPTPAEQVAMVSGDKQPILVAALLRDAGLRISGAQEGRRNTTLNGEAYGIGSLVAMGYLTAEDVLFELVAAAVTAGLSGEEALLTACSGLTAGAEATIPGTGTVVEAVARRARGGR